MKLDKPLLLPKNMKRSQGFTLIELLIVISIMTIVLSVAVPAYQSYIRDSQEGVLVSNIHTIEIFQEDFFLRNGVYADNLANIAAITTAIGWDPQSDDGITYAIADSDGTVYEVTGTHPDGFSVCIEFPIKNRCTP